MKVISSLKANNHIRLRLQQLEYRVHLCFTQTTDSISSTAFAVCHLWHIVTNKLTHVIDFFWSRTSVIFKDCIVNWNHGNTVHQIDAPSSACLAIAGTCSIFTSGTTTVLILTMIFFSFSFRILSAWRSNKIRAPSIPCRYYPHSEPWNIHFFAISGSIALAVIVTCVIPKSAMSLT